MIMRGYWISDRFAAKMGTPSSFMTKKAIIYVAGFSAL